MTVVVETPVVPLLTKKLIWQLAHVFIYLFNALQFSEEARPAYRQFFKDNI